MLPPPPTTSSSSHLHPHAQSWIQSSATDITPFFHHQNPLYQPNKMLNFYITSSPSPPVLTLSPVAEVNVLHHQPFQQLLVPLPQPVATSSVHHFYQVVCSDGQETHFISIDPGYFTFQPQTFPQRTAEILHSTLAHTTISPLISLSSEDMKERPYEEGTEKKRRLRGWRRKNLFVPPRLQKRHQNMAGLRGRNVNVRQKWEPKKKTQPDDDYGVISADGSAQTFLSPPKFPERSSSMAGIRSCKKTTVMIRNIPIKYRRNSLMQFLDVYCKNHKLEYDFFYLPMDFRRHDNLGYAFVNFTTPKAAMKIMDLLEGFEWYGIKISGLPPPIQSKKICQMSWANIQGKKALVKHFWKSNFVCDNLEYLPVVLAPPRNGTENSNSSSSSSHARKPIITIGKMKKRSYFHHHHQVQFSKK